MTGKIFQFPRTKDLLHFAGMGIKIDVEEQRESWGVTFTGVQTALRFCNLDHVEAGKMTCKFSEAGLNDETVSNWAEGIDYLEAVVETMKELSQACNLRGMLGRRRKQEKHMTKQSNALSAAEAVEPNLDRHSFVRDIGITALAGGTASAAVQAEAAPNPDAELLRLGADLEVGFAAERAAENPYFEAAFEAAYDRSAAIVHRIVAIPAKTLDGLRVKDWI